MDVHLRDLRYFVAVAEHEHFTLAAQELHVSQPAVSKQVRALETQVRAALFERDRRSVRLTPAGEVLLAHARAVLAAWDAATAALAEISATQRATLALGISTGLGRGLLPAVRARLAETAPRARLLVRQFGWHDATAGLDDDGPGRTDAALIWLPLAEPDRYHWLEVAVEDRVVALPAGHRLAAHGTVDLTDLLDEPFLALPAASRTLRDFWLAVADRGGRAPRIGGEVSSTEETIEALQAGLGVCLLAGGNAPLLGQEGIVVRPVTGVAPSRLALVWRADDDRPLLTHLRAAVRAAPRGGHESVPPGAGTNQST